MKKILIIINNFGVGGAERLVIDDANELLNRSDIDFKIITLKKEGKNSLSEQLNKNVKWECIHFNSLFDIKSYFLLYKNIKQYNPDVLFTHLWYSNTIGRIIGKLVGISKIISFEQNVYDTIKTSKMFLIDRILQNFNFRIVAVSEVVKVSLLSHGINEEKIDVIYNSVDVLKYRNVPLVNNILPKNEKFKFLFVGRLIYQKGVDVLIRAFAKISDANLYIVGQGEEEAALKKITEEEGVNDRVFFLGIRSEIASIMKECDCFVYPSRYDGLSLVLLEALASGMPIIASNIKANLEVVNNGKSGILVQVDSVSEFYNAMQNVYKNIDLRSSLSGGALTRAEYFSIKNHVDKLISYVD